MKSMQKQVSHIFEVQGVRDGCGSEGGELWERKLGMEAMGLYVTMP